MRPALDGLLRDPLFQLNATLWLTQQLPSPPNSVWIKPLLYFRGFKVYAIAPLLGPPPDIVLKAQQAKVSIQAGLRPDIVLNHEHKRKFAFIECKASSFTPQSSTAEQARSLLIISSYPLSATILALDERQVAESNLGCLLPETERNLITQTLENLTQELQQNALPVGRFSILGLRSTDNYINLIADDFAKQFFMLSSEINPFIELEPDTDPRPLYFIPYDPDIDQTREERVLCKRILFERIQSTIIVAVGHAYPPTELSLDASKMLNDAMYGTYDLWENRDSRKHMKGLCAQFMQHLSIVVNSISPNSIEYQPGPKWIVHLENQEQHENVMDALTDFSCETFDLREKPKPSLFDELEVD